MAADEIDGRSFTLGDLFEEATYAIDYYQREYAWSQKEVRTLVEDLSEEFNPWFSRPRRNMRDAPTYFMGPFVYYEERKGVRFLVDGQQRFTTIHLLFIHLRTKLVTLRERKIAEMVDRVIRIFDRNGHDRFRIDIEERRSALSAYYDGRDFEPPMNASLSVRNLHARSREIVELLDATISAEALPDFARWLLNRVVLVGIRAPNRDNGFRIFETMNDRGARLTSVDLLKSFLLSRVGRDEEELNQRWRQMLAELTIDREDRVTPERFIKAALVAQYVDADSNWRREIDEIDRALNIWVASNADYLRLDSDRQFFGFVDRLIELARHYRTFLAASRKLQPEGDLQAIYFNETNGFANQMVAILASIRPQDAPSQAKQKAGKVAAYLDRWYVRQVFGDLPLERRDFDTVVQALVGPLRKCVTINDVTHVLSEAAAEDGDGLFAEQSAFATFGMRGNNVSQIRYLLARLTGYVAVGCGKPNEIENYLHSDRLWEIEHLWPNKHGLYRHQVPDEIVFRSLRNRLGSLVLLPHRDNASLGAMPFEEKVKRYAKYNDLAAILSAGYRKNNPTLNRFVQRNNIDSLFRSFGPKETIEQITKVRQELYLRLCDQIWNPATIGTRSESVATPGGKAVAVAVRPEVQGPEIAAKRKNVASHLRTDVAKMLRAGVLTSGQRIVAKHKDVDYWATIEPDGAIVVSVTGQRYGRVDDAGCDIRNTKTCQGMKVWQVATSEGRRVSLHDLRESARADGRLGLRG